MANSREASEIKCYVNGSLREAIKAHRVNHITGGNQLNSCDFEILESRNISKSLLEKKEVRKFVTNDTLEVEIVEGSTSTVIHAGRISSADIHFGAGGEHIKYVSRLDQHMIGRQVCNVPVADQSRLGHTWIPAEGLVMNPIHDGQVRGNMIMTGPIRLPNTMDVMLVDPRSLPLNPALWGTTVKDNIFSHWVWPWPLPHIVRYLCSVLNTDESFVKNPTLRELKDVLPWNYVPYHKDNLIVRDYALQPGAALSELLDSLLEPHGFSWFIDFVGRGKRVIRVFKKGYSTKSGGGTSSPLSMSPKIQKYGSDVDQSKSNAVEMNTRFEVVKGAANSVRVVGDKAKVESTFELVPAWDEKYDDTPMEDLQNGSDARKDNPELNRVWRDWVLNENNDYTSIRDAIDGPFPMEKFFRLNLGDPIDKTFAGWLADKSVGGLIGGAGAVDFTNLGPKSVPVWSYQRRRRFLPSMTTDAERNGYYCEWWNPETEEWKTVETLNTGESSFQVLVNECGIRFTGLNIPQQMYAYRNTEESFFWELLKAKTSVEAPITTGILGVIGSWFSYGAARIRITATLQTDFRIQSVAKKIRTSSASVKGSLLEDDSKEHVVDTSGRFRYEVIDSEWSRWADFISAGRLFDEAAIDNRYQIKDLAESLLKEWNRGTLDGTVVLEGLNATNVPLGRTMTAIGRPADGKNIDLTTTPDLSGLADWLGLLPSQPGYPSIVGKSYDIDQQQTTVTIDRFRREIR